MAKPTKVDKYSYIKRDGGEWFAASDKCTNSTYRGYEARIVVKGYRSWEKRDILWKQEKQNWTEKIDDWESYQLNPDRWENNQGEKLDYDKIMAKILEIADTVDKTIPQKARELEKVLEEIDEKNKEITDKIGAGVDKLEEEKQTWADTLIQARADGNKELEKHAILQIAKIDKVIQDKLKKIDDLPSKDDYLKLIESLAADKNKTFLEKINWSNPRTYWAIGIFVLSIFFTVLISMWVWNKLKYFILKK